jgi:hypothetical protein
MIYQTADGARAEMAYRRSRISSDVRHARRPKRARTEPNRAQTTG